jgi:hypothetical protein
MGERSSVHESLDEGCEELFLRDYDGERAAALFAYFGVRGGARGRWPVEGPDPRRVRGSEGALRWLDRLELREGWTSE